MSQSPVYFRAEGDSIPFTPNVDVVGGEVVIFGGHVCIAKHDIAANVEGELAIKGIFEGPKTAHRIQVGDAIFWDEDANPVSGDAGSGAFRPQTGFGPCGGWCIKTAEIGDDTVSFKLSAFSGEPAWLTSRQIYDDE